MNTKENAVKGIEDFLKSNDRCLLLTGTNQYKKHILIMATIDRMYKNAKVLFRINGMSNINNREFLGKFISKQPKAWECFKIGNNYYYADAFTSKRTWHNDHPIDFAIIYPIDAITRGNVKLNCIDDLLNISDLKKIFLVSWTDTTYPYNIFDKYVDRRIIYDAEEEDPAYHKRVLEFSK